MPSLRYWLHHPLDHLSKKTWSHLPLFSLSSPTNPNHFMPTATVLIQIFIFWPDQRFSMEVLLAQQTGDSLPRFILLSADSLKPPLMIWELYLSTKLQVLSMAPGSHSHEPLFVPFTVWGPNFHLLLLASGPRPRRPDFSSIYCSIYSLWRCFLKSLAMSSLFSYFSFFYLPSYLRHGTKLI